MQALAVANPHVVVSVGRPSHWSSPMLTTETQKVATQHVWNEQFSLIIENLDADLIQFQVNENKFFRPLIGTGILVTELKNLKRDEEVMYEVNLVGPDSKTSTGYLFVRLQALNFGITNESTLLPEGISLTLNTPEKKLTTNQIFMGAEIRHSPLTPEKGFLESVAGNFMSAKAVISIPKLRLIFQLPSNDALVEQYECSFVGFKQEAAGKIFLFEENFCFLFGDGTIQIVLNWRSVKSITNNQKGVIKPTYYFDIVSEQSSYSFTDFLNENMRNEIRRIASFLWEKKRFKLRADIPTYQILGSLKYPEKQKEMLETFVTLVSPNELLIGFFSCSSWEGPTRYTGTLYLTVHNLCLRLSTLFTERKEIFPVAEIISIRLITTFVFPLAIQIITADDKKVFISFPSKSDAIIQIQTAWLHDMTKQKLITGSYSFDELLTFRNQFNTIDKLQEGFITEMQFQEAFGIPSALISDRIFNCMTNSSGRMSFTDFTKGLLTLTKGNELEKLSFSFRMFGSGIDGCVTKSQLIQVFKELSVEDSMPIDPLVLEESFAKLDKNNDGVITFDDYLITLEDEDLRKALGIELGSMVGGNGNAGNAIGVGSDRLKTLQNLLSGINLSFSPQEREEKGITPFLELPLTSECQWQQKVSFDLDNGWTFTSYAPVVFSYIRSLFELCAKDYLTSLKVDAFLKGLVFGNWISLSSVDNSGRSGSFLFKTDDNFLYIKSLPQAEAMQLVQMIGSYYDHIRANRDTFLTRFYGLYQVKSTKKENIDIYFVVMENCIVSEMEIHELYDLKGSTLNRSTPLEKRSSGVAMKDQDFDQNRRAIVVTTDMKNTLFNQIKLDAEFLEKHNILDYSLLVGIHLGYSHEEWVELNTQMNEGKMEKNGKSNLLVPTSTPTKSASVSQLDRKKELTQSDVNHPTRSQSAATGNTTTHHGRSVSMSFSKPPRPENPIGFTPPLPERKARPPGEIPKRSVPVPPIDSESNNVDSQPALPPRRPPPPPKTELEIQLEKMEKETETTDIETTDTETKEENEPRSHRLSRKIGVFSDNPVHTEEQEIKPRRPKASIRSTLLAFKRDKNEDEASKGGRFSLEELMKEPTEDLLFLSSSKEATGNGIKKRSYVSSFQRECGGIKANVNKNVYFFIGVIDILTQWDLHKLGEQVIKSVVFSQDSSQISSVPPPQYLARFLAYVQRIITDQ